MNLNTDVMQFHQKEGTHWTIPLFTLAEESST